MAKQVQIKNDTPINGVIYPAGKVLSVSESIFDTLGLPEYQKAKETRPPNSKPVGV